MALDDPFAAFDDLRREFKKHERAVTLLFVDLVSSTAYKAQNSEINWVTRLKKFYDVVIATASDAGTLKFLGDGILITGDAERATAQQFLDLAQRILEGIDALNKDFSGDHKLRVRIILSLGRVFLFNVDDPQGTAVDKVFRMEKFVPDNCIGMTEEFAEDIGITSLPVARFPLKGLPNPPTHGLFLSDDCATPEVHKKLRNDSYFAGLWAQPGADSAAEIILVGGHIPGGSISSVQMGDVNAKLRALHVLATLGFAREIEICDSSNFQNTAYSKNIVTIGGPCFNSVTRRFLATLPVTFEIDDEDITPLVIKTSEPPIQLNTEYDEDKRIISDWGLFVRIQNPHSADRQVIIACGIESPGVDGIVQAFTHENPNFSALMDRVVGLGPGTNGGQIPDFFCAMQFSVELGHRPVMPAIKDQVRYLHRL